MYWNERRAYLPTSGLYTSRVSGNDRDAFFKFRYALSRRCRRSASNVAPRYQERR